MNASHIPLSHRSGKDVLSCFCVYTYINTFLNTRDKTKKSDVLVNKKSSPPKENWFISQAKEYSKSIWCEEPHQMSGICGGIKSTRGRTDPLGTVYFYEDFPRLSLEETNKKMCNWHLWCWVWSQLLTQFSLHTFLYQTVVQVKLKVKMLNTLEMQNLNPSLNLYPAQKSCYLFLPVSSLQQSTVCFVICQIKLFSLSFIASNISRNCHKKADVLG